MDVALLSKWLIEVTKIFKEEKKKWEENNNDTRR